MNINIKDQIEMYTNETNLLRIVEDLASKDYPAAWYQEQISAWLGLGVVFDDDVEAKFSFSYLVQNVFKLEDGYQHPPLIELLTQSIEEANKFVLQHAYLFVEKEAAVSNSSGTSKKEQAGTIYTANIDNGRKAVISALVEELKMSKAGAGTYYNNFKSGKWES